MLSDPSVSVRAGVIVSATEVSSSVAAAAAVTVGASATASTVMVPVAVCVPYTVPALVLSLVPTFSV